MDSILVRKLHQIIVTIYVGFSLSVNGKEVGEQFQIAPISFDYVTETATEVLLRALREKLIYDVLNNTNFSHWNEVRAS